MNSDGQFDLSDPIAILQYLFLGGEPPTCLDAADADDDEEIAITDAIYLLFWRFLGGSPPPPPNDCGPDPEGLALRCDASACP